MNHALAQLAVITGIAMAAAGITWTVKGPPVRTQACDPATLKPDELCVQQTAVDDTTVWVDARPRADWMKNGVPGSVLWNLDPAEDITALEAEAMVKIASASRVIVYCGDENCGVSRQIAGRIRGLGLGVGVFVLHGGWQALRQAGLTGNGDGP